MFPRIEYLHWIDGRTDEATHDLGTSDLRGNDSGEGVVPDRLAGLEDPAMDVDLSTRIADVYGVDPGNVLVTAGASLANVVAAGAALSTAGSRVVGVDRGSRPRVVVEKPGYEPLWATPAAFGARVDRFRRPATEGYELDPDRVATALDDDTALVTVSNRHNPSGRLEDGERLAATAEVVADAGGRMLVDEVYAPYVADSRSGAFGGPTAADLERTVVTGSLTKFVGFGGLRIGWLVSDREFVETAREVADHFGALASPSVALGHRALFHRDRLAERSRALVAEHHATLSSFVDRRDDLRGEVYPDGTFAFLAHEHADGDEVVAAAHERGLLVVPGRFFEDPDRFRVSLGRDPGHVREALSVLGDALDAL